MPKPFAAPHVSPRLIDELLLELYKFMTNEELVRSEYPWAARFVMGLPLAPWQRDFCWSEEQSRRFITSAWTGIPLGTYVRASSDDICMSPGNQLVYAPFANCVLDGQQRLRALEMYFMDELAVEDASGILTKWSELSRPEQMWFGRVVFNCGITRETDESKLRAYYDILNFGGVAHDEQARASAHASRRPVTRP